MSQLSHFKQHFATLKQTHFFFKLTVKTIKTFKYLKDLIFLISSPTLYKWNKLTYVVYMYSITSVGEFKSHFFNSCFQILTSLPACHRIFSIIHFLSVADADFALTIHAFHVICYFGTHWKNNKPMGMQSSHKNKQTSVKLWMYQHIG